MVIAAWIVVRLIRNRILGRRTTVTDAIVQETHTAYEFEDRTIATWGATYPVAYEYDPWGRLVAMATTREPTCANQNLWYLLGEGMLLSDTSYPDYPPELDTTLWSYDLPTGLLISKTYADGQGPSYTYTFDGKLATRTWARGVTTEYSYASCCNSLTNIAYSDDTPDVAYAYDRLGRITSAIAAGVATNLFEYDGLDLAGETQNGIAITRATDSLGRPAGFTLGSDYEVGYGYDAYGRFHSVSSSVASATSLANYAYLPGSDLLSGMTNSSGFFWTRTYEQQRNLIASVENRFNANLISRFDYANDSLARRTRRVDNLNVTNDFGYNLRSEVIGAAMGTNRYRYAYDPIGNRLTATNNAEGWSYLSNPLNQYTNIADGTMVMPEYDLDGNTTATGDGWRYVWNGENRMILASNSQYIVTYAYDHQGRMVSKTVNGSVRQFFWDGYNIVRSLTHSQTHTLTNSFIWGLDLSGSLQGAGGVGGLLAEVKDGVPYFAAFDANGNVTEYISTNRITEAHYEYSPFGEIVVQSGDLADSFTHRFSTKPWCGVTGLSEYLFRKYEPGLGRWMSRDPIGEHGGRHLYAISRNRAANSLDPLGLCEPGEINPNSLATQNCVVHVGGEPKVNDAYDKALQSLNSLGDVEQTAEAMQLVAAYLSAGTAGALEALSSWLLKQGLGANAVGGIANNLSTFYQKRGAETQGVNLHNRVLYEECVCSFFRGWHYENRMTDWKKYVREMPGSFGNYESIADAVRDDGLARAHGLAEFRKAHGL